jgi:uncharacterized protein YkwD
VRWAVVTLLIVGVFTLQTAPALAARQDDRDIVGRVLDLTNAERQQAGLGPLALSPQLNDAAQGYSRVLASGACFEHTCGPVPKFEDRAGQAGYKGWNALGENIAAGYPTPEAVVAGWMASAGHRANILSPKFTEMGIGMVSGGPYGMYWTQEFGSRPGAALQFAPPPRMDEDVVPESGSG